MKKPLVVIAGATATGKSALAVNIAKIIGGEIISADSMQVYKYMNVGTAKVTEEEMGGIKHYLLDCLNPNESCDALRYKTLALEAMDEIYNNGHIPIICGGTGFYIQAVTRDIDFTEEDNNSVRAEITGFYEENGEDALFERLKVIDYESTLIIPKQNIKRVIRAIEFYELHHKKISDHNKEQQEKETPYNLAYFVLNRDRKLLYDKIDRRVDIMLENGLLDEVKELISKYPYDSQSGLYNAIGYKEIIDYLNGEYDYDRAVYLIKQNSRHYAKRQVTFFKRERYADFIDIDNKSQEEIRQYVLNVLREKKIITE
ncbi:MAG: tRNA (adenosine(37)-N6)-dimethylallyltransferase MiaA [Lachnospiraceae bacterium]|nr:tRNA (adenosine(37)-N6)-dimethylallyltransferase MiaA [Lachnospiraceae bacterium]